ncbi:MAG: hypothetical protein L3J66_00950 [Bacteroidales bacterium]|nr:hypothetical protein [Bacteroidales bacterium]
MDLWNETKSIPISRQMVWEAYKKVRANKSAHQALASVRENCWKTDWVTDLDIKGFFDNIDHAKLMLAVEKHVPENWVRLYIQRWLEMPVLTKSGELIQKQGKGTPQGGVISPLLSNLFLHYAFDKWLEKTDGTANFTRYADDVIVHCKNKVHAERTLNAIRSRMKSAGLELHPEKTKIVYCRDYRRKDKYPTVKFDFLGYSFQARTAKSKKTGKLFLGYKRYKTSLNRAYRWLERVKGQYPYLFYHWQVGYS